MRLAPTDPSHWVGWPGLEGTDNTWKTAWAGSPTLKAAYGGVCVEVGEQ